MARDFDGVSGSYITTGDGSWSVSTYTMSMWIEIDAYTDAYLWGQIVGSDQPVTMGITSGQLFSGHYSFGSWKWVIDPKTLPIRRWTHVCSTRDGTSGDMAMWRDKVLVATYAASPQWLGNGNQFVSGTNGASWYNGRLKHLAIWNVVLTPAEIARLAHGVSPVNVRRYDQLSCWPLDDPRAVRDTSRFGRGGVENGGTSAYNLSDAVLLSQIGGVVEVPPTGANVDAATVLVDISVSAVEIAAAVDSATVLVDLQTTGVDGAQYVDSAAPYVNVQVFYCEWFIPRPESEYIWSEYTKWSAEADTKWGYRAASKWQWDAHTVSHVTEEICV